MQTATALPLEKERTAQAATVRAPQEKPRRAVSWAVFAKKYLGKEDGHKYEWVEGKVEKIAYAMNPTQLYIQFNLQEIFMRLKVANKVTGQLLAETDLFLAPNVMRRPDFAWLTPAQVNHLAEEGAIEIPAFVIEVISSHDIALKLVDKMAHYRQAGVQVVWLIYPNQQEVQVYGGDDLASMTVCTGEKICSAAPVLPQFAVSVSDIFKKSV
jgi:Uma2 family endonuclease